MSDLISRQAVLDEMDKRHAEGDYINKGFIKGLPSADVRPNIHARWESDGHGHIVCTACKGTKLNTHRSKFCDSCGAIMDGKRQCERCIYHKENGCIRWVCIDAEVEPKGENAKDGIQI